MFGFELQNSPALDSSRKRGKNEILRSTCGKCSFSKNSNRINIQLINRGWIWILDCSFYEWIIESTNEIIFPLIKWIHEFVSDGNAWPALTLTKIMNYIDSNDTGPVERFLYDLEMKTREQNRNNKWKSLLFEVFNLNFSYCLILRSGYKWWHFRTSCSAQKGIHKAHHVIMTDLLTQE